MNILMISDETESKSFGQILSLKGEIQKFCGNKVDLFTFSNNGIFLNQARIGKKAYKVVELIEGVLGEKTYDLIVVSLKLSNLRELFPKKRNILDSIEDISPQTTTFLFGASSVINKLNKEKPIRVFLYSRPGVSKLTREFRNDVIDYIKTKKS